jgi:hypothetical protein
MIKFIIFLFVKTFKINDDLEFEIYFRNSLIVLCPLNMWFSYVLFNCIKRVWENSHKFKGQLYKLDWKENSIIK